MLLGLGDSCNPTHSRKMSGYATYETHANSELIKISIQA